MKATKHTLHYYNALHDIFSADYHDINQYLLQLYHRPKQFIAETGAPLDRFLREYTLPGAPRSTEVPTSAILEFIGQIDEFANSTVGLFDEHKAHVDQCAQYLLKVSQLKSVEMHGPTSQVAADLTDLTPELITVHEGVRKIKQKADSMKERLDKLENRWTTVKRAIGR